MAAPSPAAAVFELRDGEALRESGENGVRRQMAAHAPCANPRLLLPLCHPRQTHNNTAIRAELERTGAWCRLQARMRAAVFSSSAARDGGAAANAANAAPPAHLAASSDTFLIEELVREYLAFHGMRDTLSVFLAESGRRAPALGVARAHLESRAGVDAAGAAACVSSSLPLLYTILARSRRWQAAAAAAADELQ